MFAREIRKKRMHPVPNKVQRQAALVEWQKLCAA